MNYEFRVNELAEEFGVHRNTIRNWIKSGAIKVDKGPGRQYTMEWEDYRALCEKFGRKPRLNPNHHYDPAELQKISTVVELPPFHLDSRRKTLYDDPSWADTCLTCGTCASACPISGIDGLDPRKVVRMAFLGLEEELLASNWPWKCTMCGKCEEACPMDVEIVQLMRRIRSRRERDKVPGPIHKGVVTCLERGNNLGIPKEDFLFLLEELGDELAEDGCTGFKTPLDKHGARLLVTVNSKEPFAEPDDLKWWWKIFYAAEESWTIPSSNWEGVNWGLFSGDDEAMKTIVGRIVDNMRRLNCSALLLPE
ncbi:MAG: 4Fe-4S dicluster domain-containing protein [Desulfobulbaceae bacterium]|nr:4Fe-4S dicluster domain-containing protein [Desulfobulbaceae bacterium]